MRSEMLILLAACAACPASAQAPPPAPTLAEAKAPFVKAVAEEAVKELATQLEDSFVFPETGKAYSAMLRTNLNAGKYSSFADAQAFADAVTNDLQAVHKDGHLRVHVVPPEARSGPKSEESRRPRQFGKAVTKSGWLAEGVAYVDFEIFPGDEESLADVRNFLDAHRNAKTLIIDARHHHGGGLAEMDLMFAQLFDKPVVLVDMDTRVAVEQRRGSPVAGHPTLRQIKGPEGVIRREHFVAPAAQPTLTSTKVYLLTSKRTGSAAEHLSLALKRTHRATLVGETTAGAGHYGGMQPLDKAFTYAAFIPVGRTFDPDTGTGWEGVGVKPDVEVPADKALDEALRLAGVTVSGEAALASLK
jgi:hypothetical protein